MAHPNAFDGMMYEFCVRLGWCGCVKDGRPLHVSDLIPKAGSVPADEFVRWLIMADGLDPDQVSAPELTQLRAVFVKHMGVGLVEANRLSS